MAEAFRKNNFNIIELVGDHLRKRRFWVGVPLWHVDCFDCRGKNHLFIYRNWFRRAKAMLFTGDIPVALILPGSHPSSVELRVYCNYLDLYWDLACACFDDSDLSPHVEFDLAEPESLASLATNLNKVL